MQQPFEFMTEEQLKIAKLKNIEAIEFFNLASSNMTKHGKLEIKKDLSTVNEEKRFLGLTVFYLDESGDPQIISMVENEPNFLRFLQKTQQVYLEEKDRRKIDCDEVAKKLLSQDTKSIVSSLASCYFDMESTSRKYFNFEQYQMKLWQPFLFYYLDQILNFFEDKVIFQDIIGLQRRYMIQATKDQQPRYMPCTARFGEHDVLFQIGNFTMDGNFLTLKVSFQENQIQIHFEYPRKNILGDTTYQSEKEGLYYQSKIYTSGTLSFLDQSILKEEVVDKNSSEYQMVSSYLELDRDFQDLTIHHLPWGAYLVHQEERTDYDEYQTVLQDNFYFIPTKEQAKVFEQYYKDIQVKNGLNWHVDSLKKATDILLVTGDEENYGICQTTFYNVLFPTGAYQDLLDQKRFYHVFPLEDATLISEKDKTWQEIPINSSGYMLYDLLEPRQLKKLIKGREK